jgi:creatinine amidohydrolase
LPPVWIDLPGKLRAGAKTFAEAGATLGYFGDPAIATAAEGEILFDALAHIYVTALRERLEQSSPR